MSDTTSPRSRVRVNLALWGASLVCAALVIALVTAMVGQHRDGGGDTSGIVFQRAFAVITDVQGEASVASGTAIGGATVQAVDEAPEDEQLRNGEVLAAASRMATAFVNLDHENVDATIEAVLAQATGTFKEDYEKSSESVAKLATRAQSTMEGEVLWSGLVASDEDSATAIVATSGTVTNKTNDFQPQARNYRIQMELAREGERWLVRDLQFVA